MCFGLELGTSGVSYQELNKLNSVKTFVRRSVKKKIKVVQ